MLGWISDMADQISTDAATQGTTAQCSFGTTPSPVSVAGSRSPTLLATYSSSPLALTALATVLAGKAQAPGRSPVAVGGHVALAGETRAQQLDRVSPERQPEAAVVGDNVLPFGRFLEQRRCLEALERGHERARFLDAGDRPARLVPVAFQRFKRSGRGQRLEVLAADAGTLGQVLDAAVAAVPAPGGDRLPGRARPPLPAAAALRRPPLRRRGVPRRRRRASRRKTPRRCCFPKESAGPSYLRIAEKYSAQPGAVNDLALKIIRGGGGVWGDREMAAHPQLTLEETKKMADYILSLNSKDKAKKLPLAGSFRPAGGRQMRLVYTAGLAIALLLPLAVFVLVNGDSSLSELFGTVLNNPPDSPPGDPVGEVRRVDEDEHVRPHRDDGGRGLAQPGDQQAQPFVAGFQVFEDVVQLGNRADGQRSFPTPMKTWWAGS